MTTSFEQRNMTAAADQPGELVGLLVMNIFISPNMVVKYT